ncbi:MAG: 16S rRNA (guanine(966)-N(2))-methyltransferase RsmD [Verrucomicrobia bacterium]|nr:16S rRNA (guanine(966)-N(2))-methyltransferase RsmD [Verrucomicrobiota bacterium]
MRIFAGQFRGRILQVPKGGLRPTSGQLREALFNILGTTIAEATFLELFAGSGAVGLEALSRGAAHVTFVEKNPQAIACIERNIATLGVERQTRVFKGDVYRHLPKLKGPYSLIFADPPYLQEDLTKLVKHCAPLLAQEGTLFIEESIRAPSLGTSSFAPLQLINRRTYGDSELLEFKLSPS